jgi:hypothetical protein
MANRDATIIQSRRALFGYFAASLLRSGAKQDMDEA